MLQRRHQKTGRFFILTTTIFFATFLFAYTLYLSTPLATAQPKAALSCSGSVIHVDQSNEGATDGITWNTAYTDLQEALTRSQSCDIREIWVAQGVYRPGTAVTDTFSLHTDLALYGGFTGTETALSQRNWQANVTVLSGDIGRDDHTNLQEVVTSTAHITGANNYHVVTAEGRQTTPPP